MLEKLHLSWTGQVLGALAVFIFLSLTLYCVGLGNFILTALLAWPGAFLFQSFSFLAFYIPLFLGTLTVMASLEKINKVFYIPLFASIVPFVTTVLLVRMFQGAQTSGITSWLVASMGVSGSYLLLGLLSILEVLSITLLTVIAWQTPLTFSDLAAHLSGKKTVSAFFGLDMKEVKTTQNEANVANNADPDLRINEVHEQSFRTSPFVSEPAMAQSVSEFTPLQEVNFPRWSEDSDLRNDPFFNKEEEPQSVADIEEKKPLVSFTDPELGLTPDEAAEIEAIFREDEDLENAYETPEETQEELSALPSETLNQVEVLPEPLVVDWDHLKPKTSTLAPVTFTFAEDEADDLAADELEEVEELEAELEAADGSETLINKAQSYLSQKIQAGQNSTVIRPMEGGSIAPRTVRIIEPLSLESDKSSSVPAQGTISSRFKKYFVPIDGLLTQYEEGNFSAIDEETKRAAHTLKMTLGEFNIEADVTGIRKGPVVTMFEILPAAGVKLSKIVALQDNIALGLAATSVRIVAPIPGKHAVGIEVPNKDRSIVGFAELIRSKEFQESRAEIPMVLGKDISGDPQIIDLARTPHLLIAGATGSGKSVCVNTLICSILYRRSPNEVKLLMVDPKIVELKFFNDIPHLLAPVITEPKKALQAIQWCLYEMERRYALLDAVGAKDIRSFNAKIEKKHIATTHLPYIVLVIDEFADLMATSAKDLEGNIARLAAMSRAVGIHLVLATQRPSVDVITGLIKANFPSRIAFMVASKTDSRIIIDQMGAEKLLGRGDMLFTSSWNPFPGRLQGAFLSEDDVERVVNHVKTLGEPEYISDEIFYDEDEEEALESSLQAETEMDPLFEKAVEVVNTYKKASASFLQRRLGIGYNRAAKIIEVMEEMGMIGPQNGSKPREIVHSA